jgi:hypothetical protein
MENSYCESSPDYNYTPMKEMGFPLNKNQKKVSLQIKAGSLSFVE